MFLSQFGKHSIGWFSDGPATLDIRHPACKLHLPGSFGIVIRSLLK